MKGRKFLDAAVYIDTLESPTASSTNGDVASGGDDGGSTSYMNRFKSAMRSSSSGGGKGTSQHSISSTFFGLRSNSPNRSARPEPVYVKKSLAVLLVQDPTLFILVKSVSVLEYEVLVSLPFYLVGKYNYYYCIYIHVIFTIYVYLYAINITEGVRVYAARSTSLLVTVRSTNDRLTDLTPPGHTPFSTPPTPSSPTPHPTATPNGSPRVRTNSTMS